MMLHIIVPTSMKVVTHNTDKVQMSVENTKNSLFEKATEPVLPNFYV